MNKEERAQYIKTLNEELNNKTEITRGKQKFRGVIEKNGKIVCAGCEKGTPKVTMEMHMDGIKTYTSVFRCECGNLFSVLNERTKEEQRMWGE